LVGNGISRKALALWPHQHAALDTVDAYFASGSARACLVNMPTGTGKTGVMAAIACQRAHEQVVLVVCPSAALVEQLSSQLKDRFWDKIGAAPEWKPDWVWTILPSNIQRLTKDLDTQNGKRIILVCTVQAIQQINADGKIGQLHGRIGTILFDEGHREPAPSWARVVRGFSVPTVLFSATPFRGDLKIFDVDDDHIHFLSFTDAVSQCVIRDVEIDEQALPVSIEDYAEELVARVDALVANGRFTTSNKVIVRCDREESVREMHEALNVALAGRTDGILAIHNNFPDRPDDGILNTVPRNLSEQPERFLIHQFMLIEGIDDPLCTVLALYEPFTNTRMLVQQIGRLIRHPGPIGAPARKAYVLATSGHNVADDWNSFISFDKASKENGNKPFVRNDATVLENLIAALPTLDYVMGRFRERPDLDDPDLHDDLRFPSAAVAFSIEQDLNLDDLQTEIRAELSNHDRHQVLSGQTADGLCRYHITLRLTPSPFLSGSLFQSPSLEATIYAKKKSHLFFFDSAGLWINELDGIGPRINAKTFRALLPDGQYNNISFMSVKNTDLGPLALRSRSLSARSLDRSGVFMGEHLNVVTRASGYIHAEDAQDGIRRSVGFTRSRVRDGKGNDLTPQQYSDWCDAVASELETAAQAASIFSRFAVPDMVPSDPTPLNILVDMAELDDQFVAKGQTAAVAIEDLCVEVEEDTDQKAPAPFRFTLRVDGEDHSVWIDWNAKKGKYWLISPSLSRIKTKDNPKISLTRRLNQLQPFRIITRDLVHTYVSGDFYRIDLDLTGSEGAAKLVLDLITAIPGLNAATSEKGELTEGHVDSWADGSLFDFIDKSLRPDRGPSLFGRSFQDLVCDDLQNEVGDFLGLDESLQTPAAVLVAGKSKKGKPGVSASAFYDVCAQGLKNLAYMKSDGAELPGSETRYDGLWRLSKRNSTITQTVNRKRHGRGSRAFRKAFQLLRTSPTTDREIWLVCSGGMLSLEKLKKEFAKPQPKPHVLQFYHLVLSSYSACQSVGVRLRIFCAE
jgi:superfamily II DNA or RNA helicase